MTEQANHVFIISVKTELGYQIHSVYANEKAANYIYDKITTENPDVRLQLMKFEVM